MAGKSVPKVKQKLDKKDLTLSLAFLLPAILITVIFVIYPVFDTVGLSFRKWNGMFGAAKQWVGLENYQKIFSDKLFWNAMLNSVYFMIGGFVILMPLSYRLFSFRLHCKIFIFTEQMIGHKTQHNTQH